MKLFMQKQDRKKDSTHYPFNLSKNSFSLHIGIPNSLALVNLLPAFSPHIKAYVFLLTLSLVEPPKSSINLLALSLVILDKVPVKTKVLSRKLVLISLLLSI